MSTEEKIKMINQVVANYFAKNKQEVKIVAKDLMPEFMEAGIFTSNHRDGLPLRKLLRDLDSKSQLSKIPLLHPERKGRNTYWYFVSNSNTIPTTEVHTKPRVKNSIFKEKKYKDEHYVIDLCDEVLNLTASRQHRFDFLLGDVHKDGVTRTKLPVDAYYKELNLVIEYYEKQHTESVAHFDKPDVKTVSGVSRGEQRKLYDQRRKEQLPKNGINLIIIDYTQLSHNGSKDLIRDKEKDIAVLKTILEKYSQTK